MTALGSVMALIRELEGESPNAVGSPGLPGPETQVVNFPPSNASDSSLGEVLALIRKLQGESLEDLTDSLKGPAPC